MTNSPTLQHHINEYWDKRGAVYDAQPGHGIGSSDEREAWLVTLQKLLPPTPANVLDVGTGTGFLALLLADLGYRVTGVDLAEGMLAEARTKAATLAPDHRPILLDGDAHEPPLPPSSQDAIVSRHVLWTLADPMRALSNWYALLRPGGHLVAIDGLWWQGRDPNETSQMDAETQARWSLAYGTEARHSDRLPLMLAQTMDPIISAVEAAGFTDVKLSGLEHIEEMERRIRPERERSSSRYVVTARRPA